MDKKSWAKQLPPHARQVLDAGLAVQPSADARSAIWTELSKKLPVAATGTGIGALALLKPVGAGLVLGVVGAGSLALVQLSTSAPPEAAKTAPAAISAASTPSTTTRRDAARAAPPLLDPTTNRSAAPPSRAQPTPLVASEEPASATLALEAPPPSPSIVAFPSDAAAATPPPPASASATPNAVLVESNRVAHVRTLLQQGNSAGVLSELAELDRLFPRGVLRQERDALRVEALLASGDRAAAREAAQRFLARYPRSPHLAAVERALR